MKNARKILKKTAPGCMWKGKSIKQMSDQDCIDCLNYLRETCGILYVDPM